MFASACNASEGPTPAAPSSEGATETQESQEPALAGDDDVAPNPSMGTPAVPRAQPEDRPCGPDEEICGPHQICQTPVGGCGHLRSGRCTNVPEMCPLMLQPVCGCDGVSYGNGCEAAMARTSVRSAGPCEEAVAPSMGSETGGAETSAEPAETILCVQGSDCPDGLRCDMSDAASCAPPIRGVCAPAAPEHSCRGAYRPECGCNGVTYVNACERQRAGIARNFVGSCEDGPTARPSPSDEPPSTEAPEE